MSANADQKIYWNETAGDKWVANQAMLDRFLAPLTEVLLQEAVPAQGEQVLDIGCGCGDLALRVAAAVGARGGVLGVDLSRPMLARARERAAAHAAGSRVGWREADVTAERFEPAFDLLVSRFGVMFFDDKPAAFAALRAAAKPGGRLCWLAWRGRDEVEWMAAPLGWIAPAIEPPAPTDGEVGPFGLADGEGTRLLLEAAGFRDVICEPVDRTLVLGETVEAAYGLLCQTGPAAAAIRDADEVPRRRAKDLLRAALEAQADGGRVEMHAACWIFRGVL